MKWIFHERNARVIYSLTTDRQPVIYRATNYLLARLYFDSNKQTKTKNKQKKKTMKMQMYPSNVASFPPLHEKKSRQNFCYRGVSMYLLCFRCEKIALHRLTSMN